MKELIEASPFGIFNKFQLVKYIDSFEKLSREIYDQLDVVASLWIENES